MRLVTCLRLSDVHNSPIALPRQDIDRKAVKVETVICCIKFFYLRHLGDYDLKFDLIDKDIMSVPKHKSECELQFSLFLYVNFEFPSSYGHVLKERHITLFNVL